MLQDVAGYSADLNQFGPELRKHELLMDAIARALEDPIPVRHTEQL